MKPFRSEHIQTASGFLLTILCTLLFASCDESLPARNDPADVLVVTSATDYYDTKNGDAVYITIKIRNNYSEVLSDVTSIYGNIEITWMDDPTFRKHITLSTADMKGMYFDPIKGQIVASKSTYNAASKTLTIPIGEPVVFQYMWDLKSDSLRDLHKELRYVLEGPSTLVGVTKPITFKVTSSIHLYENVPMFYPDPVVLRTRLRMSFK